MRKVANDWHGNAVARDDVVESFEADAKWLSKNLPDDENRRVLFCFLSDPYQPLESRLHLTRKCLAIAKEYRIKVDILTKGSYARVSKDFQLMKDARVHLGVTLAFISDDKRKFWEPRASTVSDRLRILKEAHELGIYTWVSMEPVIAPEEALAVVDAAHDYVSFWKVGKLNHNKEIESKVDWAKFLSDVTARFQKYRAKYYIKNDLISFGM